MKKSSLSMSAKDRQSLIGNLGTMLVAGIPIDEAVASLKNESKGNLRKVLACLQQDLNGGRTVSESFSQFPGVFDPVIINLIKASEQAGNLETTLKDLSLKLKKDMEFNSQLQSALIYPAFVVVVFSIVITLLFIYAVPQMAQIFSQMNVDLPITTKIIIKISYLLTHYPYFFLAGLTLVILLIVYLYKKHRKYLLNLIFGLPVLSHLALVVDLSRFSRSMALLLASGIPIVEAVALSEHVVTKRQVIKVVKKCQAELLSGRPISGALKQNKRTIPSFMILLTEVGERSGSLENSMQELSEYFDEEVAVTLKALVSLLEPSLMVVIGLVVGTVMWSILIPIYSLLSHV